MGLWIMAGVTFREAARKKILWIGFLAGIAFLTLFGTGMHFQVKDFNMRTIPPLIRYQAISAILQVGFYAVDLLAVVMTVLTSVDTISGEISSGMLRPRSRAMSEKALAVGCNSRPARRRYFS